MLTIDYSKQAENFLRKIPVKHAKQIIGRICELAENPDSSPTVELKGFAPYRRLKSGEYRIIYMITNEVLEILLVGKHNDDEVYELMKRVL